MYKAIERFADLMDGGHVYRKGDVFPRPGADATVERLSELAGTNNRMGRPLIEAVEAPKQAAKDKPKETIKRTPRTAKKAVSERQKG